MKLPINVAIIREPYNWITVAVMLSFAALAVAILANGGRLPPSPSGLDQSE